MDSELIKELRGLAQLDYDVLRCYDQALEHVDLPSLREELRRFRGDHERHVRVLCDKLRQLGGATAGPSRDLLGLLLEGYAAVRSMTGTEGALKALRRRERAAGRRYEEAAGRKWPDDLRLVVCGHVEDERRHLAYVERVLVERVWESWAVR